MRLAGHIVIALALTALSLTGGLAWLIAFRPRGRFAPRALRFVLIYALLWGAVWLAAPLQGRTALPCTGTPLRAHPATCVLGRHYVSPMLASLAEDSAAELNRRYPGTLTRALDGGFGLTALPLLPHLSHGDGEKLDLAFFYRTSEGPTNRLRSPIGYFAFETLDAAQCPDAGLSLRWDLHPLQSLWRQLELDPARTNALIDILARDPRSGKLFVEPALARSLGLSHPKIRFQGCRAARHDDHIHLQL